MTYLRSTVVVFALLALAGCDRFADDGTLGPGSGLPGSPDPPALPTETSGSQALPLFLKGPDDIQVRGEVSYRSEYAPGAVRYAWGAVGEGNATVTWNERDAEVVGTLAGTIQLRVIAYGADGRPVGVGTRTLTVHP